uniref:Uncharacterized protein n=1 Tax=Spongospora subterranea TaxID=70186 RepID=A0A0H5QYY1_9EUKA|eukprot:CRZ06881.1 hypothetical protein [Spongospora subterranea]
MSSDLDGSVVGSGLPFPVGLIEEEYTRFILVLYDSYIATCSNPIPRPRTGVVDLLQIAAESGDIGFLHKMKQRFGGVLYNRYYIEHVFSTVILSFSSIIYRWQKGHMLL